MIDVLNRVNLLREREVAVKSISDGIVPETSTGKLMLNMSAPLAECERELITERVNAGQRGDCGCAAGWDEVGLAAVGSCSARGEITGGPGGSLPGD